MFKNKYFILKKKKKMYFIFTYVNESDKIRKSILIPNVKVFISLKGGGGFLYFKIKCKQFLCIHNKQYILINNYMNYAT